jgi:signal transduction histidine kinase
MFLRIKHFFRKLVLPLSQNEDEARREFILNVLLVAIISLCSVAFVVNLLKGFMNLEVAMSAVIIFIPLSFFVSLYFLSRKGFLSSTSFIFLGVFFLLNSYTAFKYGVDIPAGLMVYALIIVMSGILISTRCAFYVTLITVTALSFLGYLQIYSILPLQSYWRKEILTMADVVLISVIFSIIATVSWLSNREIEKSLVRARKSEAELKKERDSLEVTVEKRTKQLKEVQADKMAQLYRFAEFGRLSAGVFHDLVNPLTAVSLNMEKVKTEYSKDSTASQAKTYVDRAVIAARKMEDFVVAVRKQLTREENSTYFSLNEEIGHVIDILSHKAQKAHVSLRFSAAQTITVFGDAAKFNQVILNLIANAIEAYFPADQDDSGRDVNVSLGKDEEMILLSIKDFGMGIAPENMEKIFEPFFTTKTQGQGIGIGLSLSKRIVEKDFGGAISVTSRVGEGTLFVIQFLNKKE